MVLPLLIMADALPPSVLLTIGNEMYVYVTAERLLGKLTCSMLKNGDEGGFRTSCSSSFLL